MPLYLGLVIWGDSPVCDRERRAEAAHACRNVRMVILAFKAQCEGIGLMLVSGQSVGYCSCATSRQAGLKMLLMNNKLNPRSRRRVSKPGRTGT
jgi:hypothetical protein